METFHSMCRRDRESKLTGRWAVIEKHDFERLCPYYLITCDGKISRGYISFEAAEASAMRYIAIPKTMKAAAAAWAKAESAEQMILK